MMLRRREICAPILRPALRSKWAHVEHLFSCRRVGGTVPVTLDLHAGTLRVVVKTTRGGSSTGVPVSLMRGGNTVGTKLTDSRSITTFVAVQGTYTVQVQANSGKPVQANAAIKEGTTSTVTVTLS